MNKEQLVEAIASEIKVDKATSLQFLNAFIKITTNTLKKGERVLLLGFGSFSVRKRRARIGRNPQNGKTIKIAAKRVAKFKAGIELNTSLN